MKRSSFAFLLILCLVFAGLVPPAVVRPEAALAAPDDDTVIVAPGSPIEIAALMTSIFTTSQDHYDAIEMAMDDYGPIKGFSVQRNDFLDDCDETSGANMAGFITDNAQNVGVIGPICSPASDGAAPVLNSFDVVMISPANTRADAFITGPRVYNRVVVKDPMFAAWDIKVMNLLTVQAWETRFASTYGHPPDYIAKYAYDAAMLLLTRIDQVSQVDGSGNLVLSRIALETAVRNTFDFQGITGRVALDIHGNRLVMPQTVVQYDPFSQTSLDPAWSWIGGAPTTWSLSTVPGFLEVYTQDDRANLLVQGAPGRDFEIRTYLEFTPTENFQFGGLYLYGDDQNFMSFGRAFCGFSPPFCVGNGIYFDYVEGGTAPGSNYATAIPELDSAYLRVVAEGNNYTGYVSENGTEWTEIGVHTANFAVQKVGLIVSNATQPAAEIPAQFDFFVLQYEALTSFLPLVFR
jgi:hypothetical protein